MSVLSAQALWSSKRSVTIPNPRKNSNLFFAFGLSLFMALTIVGTLFVNKAVAFATIPVYVFAVLILSVRAPASALAVYIAYSVMEGMFKYLSKFSTVIYPIKPMLLLLVLGGWLFAWYRRRLPIQKTRLYRPIALLLLWGVAQIFHPFGRGIVESVVTLLLWYVLPVLLLPLGQNVFETKEQEEKFRMALIGMMTVVSLFAVLQYTMGRTWTEAHLPGYETTAGGDWFVTDAQGHVTFGSFRPASTGSQSGGGGGFSHIGALLCLPLLSVPGLSLRNRLGVIACLGANLLGIMVSGVRLYVVLSILEGGIFLFVTARSPREMVRSLGAAFGMLIVVGVSFGLAQVISGGALAHRYADTLSNPLTKFSKDRGSNFEYLPEFLADFPLGIGYQRGIGGRNNGASEGEVSANRETQFNAVADDMGIPGLILMTYVLIIVPVAGYSVLRRLRTRPFLLPAAMYWTLLVGAIFMGLAGPSLQGNDFHWMFAGILLALPRLEQRSAKALIKPDELVKADTKVAAA